MKNKKDESGHASENWKIQKLEKIVLLISGQHIEASKYNTEGIGVPYLTGPNDYLNNKISPTKFTEEPKSLAQKGDILITCKGEGTGIIILSDREYCISRQLMAIRPKNIHGLFLKYAIQSQQKNLRLKAVGLIPGISRSDILNIKIFVPPKREQVDIAYIISVWDKAITQTQQLIEAKQKLKRGLTQRLLSIYSNDCRHWNTVRAGELFKVRSTKNHPDEPVLSVTQDQGVVLRDCLDRKINMTKSNTKTYKLVLPGDFIISLRSFQGGLEISSVKGIVSPAYHVIYPQKEINQDFFKHYFKSYEFIERLSVAVIGIRDGKQISFSDFAFMNLPLPSLQKQTEIAQLLNSLDKEVSILQEKLEKMTLQKNGLMQVLLTGKIRVNGEE